MLTLYRCYLLNSPWEQYVGVLRILVTLYSFVKEYDIIVNLKRRRKCPQFSHRYGGMITIVEHLRETHFRTGN